jgi:plasmid replication initiation protein
MSKTKIRALDLKAGIAVSDNKLINACYRMTSMQKRLFNLAIAACNSSKSLTSGDVFVNVNDFAFLSNKEVKESVRICKSSIRDMSLLQVIDIEYKAKRSLSPIQSVRLQQAEDTEKEIARISYKNFFQEVDFIDSSEGLFLYFKFSDWLIPYLEMIKKRFAQVPLMEVSQLSSFYSMRLFDFIMASQETIEKVRVRTYFLSEYRAMLGFVEDKEDLYSRWADFRKRCLVNPIEELNEKTSLNWSFSVEGRGKKEKKITIIAKSDF